MWVTLDPLTNAVPDVVKGITEFVATIATPIVLTVAGFVWRFNAARKKAAAEADKPSVVPPPQLPGNFSDPSITAKIHEANVSIARSEWALTELRDELRHCREERDQATADATRTAATLSKVQAQLSSKQRELVSAEAKLATLEEATRQWRAIAELRQREIDELQAKIPTDRPPRGRP